MDINNITEEQKTDIVYHFRSAVLARALQWDHERAIEEICDREFDIDVASWAAEVLSPSSIEDADFITWDDIKDELSKED